MFFRSLAAKQTPFSQFVFQSDEWRNSNRLGEYPNSSAASFKWSTRLWWLHWTCPKLQEFGTFA